MLKKLAIAFLFVLLAFSAILGCTASKTTHTATSMQHENHQH